MEALYFLQSLADEGKLEPAQSCIVKEEDNYQFIKN